MSNEGGGRGAPMPMMLHTDDDDAFIDLLLPLLEKEFVRSRS
jgi:hypothetical protein